MYTSKRLRNCTSFKPIDQDMIMAHRQNPESNCKDCIYFSSRNCGMDAADSIEPTVDILC